MAESQVFWTDFRTPMYGENLPAKFKRLLKTAGIGDIDLDGKFVAIKMHFGELDQACADACNAATPLAASQLGDNMRAPGFQDLHDVFRNSRPYVNWQSCLAHAEKIGLGSREYELVKIRA